MSRRPATPSVRDGERRQITPVGFGAWALGGGGWEFGWGPPEDDESVAAIRRAIDLGINWIDTAQVDPVVAAVDLRLTEEDVAEIEAAGLR